MLLPTPLRGTNQGGCQSTHTNVIGRLHSCGLPLSIRGPSSSGICTPPSPPPSKLRGGYFTEGITCKKTQRTRNYIPWNPELQDRVTTFRTQEKARNGWHRHRTAVLRAACCQRALYTAGKHACTTSTGRPKRETTKEKKNCTRTTAHNRDASMQQLLTPSVSTVVTILQSPFPG